MSVLLTSDIYIDSVLTASGTTVSLGYQREQQIVAAGEGTWVTVPTTPSPPPSPSLYRLAPGYLDIRDFGAKCDGIALYDATTTNSTTCTITSATASFTTADIGKSCSVIPATANNAFAKYGSITSVTNSTTIVATLNATPGVLTGATFVYGTDDTAAIASAATAASNNGTVFIPQGITCTTATVTLPDGVNLIGVGNTATVDFARNFKHRGSSVVLVNYVATVGMILVGDASSSNKYSQTVSDLNLDCLNLAPQCVITGSTNATRAVHFRNCTMVRGTNYTGVFGPSNVVEGCVLIQQQYGHVVSVAGDSRFLNNYVYGAGNGKHGFRVSQQGDVQIIGNHIWKDADTPTALGSAVYIENYSTNVAKGQVTVAGNSFDTSFGPHIDIRALNTSNLRGITITGNEGFQNDNVPNATYPFIKLTVDVGAQIRALTISGNTGTSSWNDPTKGQYTYFVDGSAVAGNVYGSIATANAIDNCAALYSFSATWTAWDHDGGNLVIAGTGTVVTKSTIA